MSVQPSFKEQVKEAVDVLFPYFATAFGFWLADFFPRAYRWETIGGVLYAAMTLDQLIFRRKHSRTRLVISYGALVVFVLVFSVLQFKGKL